MGKKDEDAIEIDGGEGHEIDYGQPIEDDV
jgi:hypothetical protein